MLFRLVVCLILIKNTLSLGEIIFALNAGGDNVVDSHGIRYKRDYLSSGIASDYGRSLDIKRVPPSDKILYQTERYSTETFGYSVALSSENSDYVLWLKFSEVWFNAPNQKIFDVTLNGIPVIQDMDIFARVGRGVAHDEVIPFKIKQNKLIVGDKTVEFNKEIRVEFVKKEQDNPKVNAIIIMKGTPNDVPTLEPYEPKEENVDKFDEENDDDLDDYEQQEEIRRKMSEMQEGKESEQDNKKHHKKRESIKYTELNVDDPYASDESSYLIPILVAIGAFIPLLFFLCKL